MCVAPCVHHNLVPLPEMGRRKFRTLKEIYQYGTHPESMPTQPLTYETEEKSRSCDLRATWCSSCVHFERVAAAMDVGIDDFADKTYEGKRSSRCSSNDSILFFPSLNTACDCRQHTSSEASNVFSVSSSHDSFSENAESQATFRDSDSCEDTELILNGKEAQPCKESGDIAKGLTGFDDQRLSNQLVKYKELDILDDNLSCISRSESTNLAIGTHFDEANGNHRDAQNFTEKPPLAVNIPNRSDQSDLSSLQDFYECAISVKGELSECSSEQVESSLVRTTLSGLGTDDVYSFPYAASVGADPRLNSVETNSHSYRKKHLRKYDSVIENSILQKSWQIQEADPRTVSDLMGDEITVCDTCGDTGKEKNLAICSKCTDGAEHIYCMRVKRHNVPGDWICQECTLRSGCQKSESPVNLVSWSSSGCQKSESPVNLVSWSSSKLKFEPSHAKKRQTESLSSTSRLPAKRSGIPLQGQSVKKGRIIGMSADPPRSSKNCYNSCKNFKNEKVNASKNITHELKAKVPPTCGDKRHACILEANLKKKRTLETRVTLPSASTPSSQILSSREPSFKKLGKGRSEALHSVSSVKQSSYCVQEKPKLPKLSSITKIERDKCSLLKSGSSKTADLKFKGQLTKHGGMQKHKVGRNLAFDEIIKEKNLRMMSKSVSLSSASSEKLNAACSKVILGNPNCSVVLKNSSSAEGTKTAKGSCSCGVDNPQNLSKLDCRLQPNIHDAYKNLNGLNKEKKSERQESEQSTKPATAVKVHTLCTDFGSAKRSQFKAAVLPQDVVIPKFKEIWQGKFQIQRSEGIAITCVGIQAHLSTCASQKVLDVVKRLSETLVLEELPRTRMWPSQFVESHATEQNIAVFFFAKDIYCYRTYYRRLLEYMIKSDLALKGNLDGVELLIFPSNVLPEKSQRWNAMFFLWGVFRGQKVNKNPENISMSSSRKREYRDIASHRALNLNADPQDSNAMARVDEVGKLVRMCTRSSGDKKLFDEHSYYPGSSYPSLSRDRSLRPKSATPKDSPRMPIGSKSDKSKQALQGKRSMEEKINDNDNFEMHGKLPMDEENNAYNAEVHDKLPAVKEGINGDNVKPSRPSSVVLALPAVSEENAHLNARQAAEALVILSKGERKI